jgi:hypothetical protein
MNSPALTAPSPRSTHETLALSVLLAATVVTFAWVPAASWASSPLDPCHLACLGAIATVAALVVTSQLGDRGLRLERVMGAVFLASMPLVYVASCLALRSVHESAPLPWLELIAVPLYGGLAALGLRRWPALLPAGIALHGLGWDAWHYGRAGCVPDWYAAGCLLLDLTMGIYFGARLARWRRVWKAER